MKRNFAVNIGYRLFNIDEDAYERLQDYLERLRAGLGDSEAGEVMKDIEIRIAELLAERIGESREVVILSDIEFVVGELGEAEQIGDFAQNETAAEGTSRDERRLFRDTDDRVFGGVCSGLASFFEIDALWVRIAFVVLFLIGGSGLLIYLILWLVVPPALTPADKLRMKGKKVNVSNLSNRIRNEFDQVRNTFRKRNHNKGNATDKQQSSGRSTGKAIVETDAFRSLMYAGAVVLGIFLIVTGFSLLAGFTVALFSDYAFWGQLHVSGVSYGPVDIAFTLAANPWLAWSGFISLLLLFVIPLVSMIIAGLRMIFRFGFPVRMYNRIAVSMWATALTIFGAIMIYHAIYFSKSTYEQDSITLVKTSNAVLFDVAEAEYHMLPSGDKHDKMLMLGQVEGQPQLCVFPEILFLPVQNDSNIRLTVHVQRSGNPSGLMPAEVMPLIKDSTTVIFKPYFPVAPSALRFVSAEVYVPVGQTIQLSDAMQKLLESNHRFNDQFHGRRHFIMTNEGLRPSQEKI